MEPLISTLRVFILRRDTVLGTLRRLSLALLVAAAFLLLSSALLLLTAMLAHTALGRAPGCRLTVAVLLPVLDTSLNSTLPKTPVDTLSSRKSYFLLCYSLLLPSTTCFEPLTLSPISCESVSYGSDYRYMDYRPYYPYPHQSRSPQY